MSKKVKRVAIIGHGSHARMLKQLLIESGYFFSGFIEIKKSTNFNRNKKDEVIGDLNSIMNIKKKFDYVVLGIGDNIKRYQIFENLKKKNVNIFTYIHHSAYVSKFSKIGTGSVVLIGSKINGKTIRDPKFIKFLDNKNLIIITSLSIYNSKIIREKIKLLNPKLKIISL